MQRVRFRNRVAQWRKSLLLLMMMIVVEFDLDTRGCDAKASYTCPVTLPTYLSLFYFNFLTKK